MSTCHCGYVVAWSRGSELAPRRSNTKSMSDILLSDFASNPLSGSDLAHGAPPAPDGASHHPPLSTPPGLQQQQRKIELFEKSTKYECRAKEATHPGTISSDFVTSVTPHRHSQTRRILGSPGRVWPACVARLDRGRRKTPRCCAAALAERPSRLCS